MRGAWLVLIVRLGWTFSLRFNHLVLQVIFAIGAAMMALAVLVHLPRWGIAAAGIAMIAGHNMFDGVKAGQFGAAAPIWSVLHQPRSLYRAAGELDSRCSYKAAHTTGRFFGSFSGHSAAWTFATSAAPACMVAARTW